jgi:exonuclease SbcD
MKEMPADAGFFVGWRPIEVMWPLLTCGLLTGWRVTIVLMKFLHIADVHLGCTRYQLPESPRDFYDAWVDVLRRYGIDEGVDFVIMCGDFFHKKSVPPETMNYAVEGLTMMQEAGIPVIAIEGNHDQRPTDNEFSWLRSLSKWGLVKLLEPTRVEGEIANGATLT